MEEPQEPGVAVPFSSPPHRRSHLRSGTYRNLVRLISLCYGDSPLATAPPIIPLPQTLDNGGNKGELGGDDVRESGESIVSDSREPAKMVALEGKVVDGGSESAVIRDKGLNIVSDSRKPAKMVALEGKVVDGGSESAVFPDKGLSETQMVLDEIEKIMGIEEGQDLLNQNDMMVNSSMEGTGFRDGEIGGEQMLMAELENIMKGNEDCDKISNSLTTPLGRNQGDRSVGILLNNQEEHNDSPSVVMEESGPVGLPQVEMVSVNQKIIEAFGFSPDKSLTAEVSKSSDKVEDQSSSLKTNLMHEKIEILQKEMELEKFVCSNDKMPSPSQLVEDGELEEGEIFGDIQLVNESIDILLDDVVVSEKMVEGKQVAGGNFDDKHLHCNEESTADDKNPEFISFNTNVAPIANRITPRELEGSERYQMVSELGMMHRKEGSGKIQKQIGSKTQAIKSEMKNVGVSDKKKQSLIPAEKKEKKKKNKRKKRAEKNRQLGVKRLKLQTVLKPKTVTYCRHYLKGRCYEAEKCKFSHDTVPLTKSQPCSHFARHSCLKGDDCPFDHQLSKYPCTNYVTKGSCSRGDDCLFSHKMSPEGDVASLSNARELQLKPSLQGDSDMRLNISKASLKNADASSYSEGAFSHKSKKQIVADTSTTKTPGLACKGVNSFFVSKSTMAESIKLNQGSLSQKLNESGRVGIQSNERTLGVNSPLTSQPSPAEYSKFSQGSSSLNTNEGGRLGIQANQSESRAIQNVNDSPKRKPEVVPRGINFLSFGKSSLEDSPSKVSLGLNRADGCRQLSSENEGDRGKLSKQTQGTSNTDQKRTQPLGINLLTLGKLVNSGSNTQASVPCCSDNVNNGSLSKINYAADKQHNSSEMSYKLPVSPQTSGKSSEWLAHRSTPNSAQKALISTLAAAKKFDNVKGKSLHESQHLSDKQYDSNANPWKMPTSMLVTDQSSEKITTKSTPNSTQKAPMSTLAFAAMLESGMKKNQSGVRTAVNSETGDGRIGEGSKTGSAKISKLLDILSSIGSKTK